MPDAVPVSPPAPQPSVVAGGTRSLRELAVRGGAYLVAREALGMLLRMAGVVLTVREIGPAAYGVYSAAAAFAFFVSTTAQMGAEVYLIRLPGEPDRRRYHETFTFLLCTSVAMTALALALTFAVGSLLRPHGVLLPLRVLLLVTPINVLWAPAQACIERQFGYRRMGALELVGDLALYGTAIPLAVLGAGAWSLVAGYAVWQAWLLVGSLAMSGLRPRIAWSGETMRDLARHGLTFSASGWFTRLGGLVNPLIVGSFAGATGVGYVAFAQRLVDTVGFARRGAYRLGMVAMARVPDDQPRRLRAALEDGSLLQLVSLAVPFAAFGVVAPWVVPAVFGHEWVEAIPLYSILAVAVVVNASGLIQVTLMFSRGWNTRVAVTMAIEAAVLAGAAYVLVHHLGVDGYAYATLLSMLGLVYLDRAARRVTPFSYRRMLPFALVLIPPVLMPFVPYPAALLLLTPAVAALALPGVRAELVHLMGLLRLALPGAAR